MVTVVIPPTATSVPCPNCGLVIHNLAPLGIRHQVGCKCGAKVIVERRKADQMIRRRQAPGRQRVG
jgi:transposase